MTALRTQIRSKGHETCNHKAYQLPCAEYEELLARADGRCEICRVAAAETVKGKLVIDHQYGTSAGLGAVRGLVCVSCNSVLGNVDAGKQVPQAQVTAYLANAWHVTRPQQWSDRKRHPRAGRQDARITFRYPRADWQEFGAVAIDGDTTIASAIRNFIDWYIRKKGAKAPRRPAAPTE